MQHRLFACFFALALLWSSAMAADEAPDALVQRLVAEAAESAPSGGAEAMLAFVDAKVMPHVDFARMTASAVGRSWRQATPEQQARLQQEFKLLLVRSYAGALTQLKDLTVSVKPLRASPEDTELVVRSVVKGHGDALQLDYRMRKSAEGWKICDINVMGVWLVDTYRGQFSGEINAHGIDGLIATLAQRNRPMKLAAAQ
ncbi:MAG TPA: ABC transporter substrate-binding protein [Albitalea sp.]|nr:ABC transporter substrate-binding protein [Albitalea sp.]